MPVSTPNVWDELKQHAAAALPTADRFADLGRRLGAFGDIYSRARQLYNGGMVNHDPQQVQDGLNGIQRDWRTFRGQPAPLSPDPADPSSSPLRNVGAMKVSR